MVRKEESERRIEAWRRKRREKENVSGTRRTRQQRVDHVTHGRTTR